MSIARGSAIARRTAPGVTSWKATRYTYSAGFVARRSAEHLAAVRHLETVLRETALG